MREIITNRAVQIATGAALGAIMIEGCTVDSYLTNPAAVQCDGKRTKTDLVVGGMATFIVHGKHNGEVATIQVRSSDLGVSAKVTGDVTGPPQQLEADGYTKPLPIVPGAEISTFGAGGAWVIDASKDSVVIQGTCDGM